MELSTNVRKFLEEANDAELKYFFSVEACNGDNEEWAKRFLLWNKLFVAEDDEYESAPFHLTWAIIFSRLIFALNAKEGREYATILSAREQAKTALERSLIAYCVLYEVTPYIAWASADQEKNKTTISAVKQIIGSHLIQDVYGNYLPRPSQVNTSLTTMYHNENDKKKLLLETYTMKTISKFRGQVHPYTRQKAMFIIGDDKETVTTLSSVADTEAGWKSYTQDGIQSMNQKCRVVLATANYLSTLGNTERDKLAVSQEDNLSVIPLYIMDKHNKPDILWKAKYVLTDEEADGTGKISVESIKRECERLERLGEGYNIFEREYLCQPISAEMLYHDIDKVKQYMMEIEPLSERNGVKFFKKYDPSKLYTMGVDTSAGVGRDAQSLFVIEHSINRAEEAAIFVNNTSSQKELFDTFYAMSQYFNGEIYIVGDANYGMVFNEELKKMVDRGEYDPSLIYVSDVTLETQQMNKKKTSIRWGILESTQNKEVLANSFRYAVENGELILHSAEMWATISSYTKEAHVENKRTARDLPNIGRHWDLLDAARKAYFGVQNRTIKRKEPKTKIKTDGLTSRERLVKKWGV